MTATESQIPSQSGPIRVADYIVRTLADEGVRHVFLVTGGGAMHLNDAIARESRIAYICNHHEQASAMAAEGYARISGQVGVACVTSGPGGVNALNGVYGAWTDSIPLLVISGQMKRETLLRTHNLLGKLRQLGDQEVDIVSMVTNITKYAQIITEPNSIRYHLERALYLAQHGRPGPCWLDIPVDVQSAQVDPSTLRAYDPNEDAINLDDSLLDSSISEVVQRLSAAKRPVILAGTGVRLSPGGLKCFRELIERLQIPVTTAWTHDLISSDHPLFCGRQGTIGTRAGNFTVQNADFLLILGSRMCIRQISYNWKKFAPHAYIIQVDIDASELDKPTLRAHMPVHADVAVFMNHILGRLPADYSPTRAHQSWLGWCRQRLHRYPSVQEHQRIAPDGQINAYHFIELLFATASANDIFVCANATACITAFQAGSIKEGQRLFSNSGSASMGYDLPAAIGAACANHKGVTICLAGDGSIQMNIQEMATIAHHRWPIKVFILCNGGYHSIHATQNNFFGQLIGEGPSSGLTFPDFVRVAEAYGLRARRFNPARATEMLGDILGSPTPEVCVVELDQSQTFEPKLASRQLPDGRMETAPLEDMAPFLSRDELIANMITPESGDCHNR